MKCHVCGEPAIGQCQSCWKFYCATHGNVFCEECSEAKGSARRREPGQDADKKDAPLTTITVGGRIADDEEVRRVIPVVQSQTHGDTRVTVISLEVYDSGFAMIHRLQRSDRPHTLLRGGPPIPIPLTAWTAVDDNGLEYNAGSSSSSGDGDFWRLRADFTPNLSPDAKVLVFSMPQVQWSSAGPMERSPGPWRFEVPLA